MSARHDSMLALPAFTHAPDANRVYNCDALTLLRALEPQSVDAIITDLPYGTTACTWDTVIPFAPMWAAVKRVLKPRGVFVTTASQPFTSALVMSNLEWFKCEWIWDKVNGASGLLAEIQPLKVHENILVFSPYQSAYYPQMTQVKNRTDKSRVIPAGGAFGGDAKERIYSNNGLSYPKSILTFSNAIQADKKHPTQKSLQLYEYLISTYTQPGDLVVDPCCGSGTTGVAARNLKRDYILNDKEAEYVEIARDRLRQPWDKRRTKESDLSGLPLFAEAVL